MEEQEAFRAILVFASADDRNFAEFFKYANETPEWECCFGVYGFKGELLWEVGGIGETIYAAALSAIRNRQDMLRG